MGFLQPLALWGLAAVAVPPLLHLLARRVPPTVPFPALRYLSATEREHSRRLKLRNLLLMALRMLLIALIVLAAARPVANVGSGALHPPTAIALVVDNSLSSGAVIGGRAVMDQIRDEALAVVAAVLPGDELWLVLADGAPQRLSATAAATLVDTLSPWPVRLDVTEAVRDADAMLARSALTVREIAVVSDLQRSAFSAGTEAASAVVVWAAPTVEVNRGIDSIAAEPLSWSPRGSVVATIGGGGGGDRASAPAAVRLVADRDVLARAVAAVGDRVVLRAALPTAGWHILSVELDPDELRGDDRRWVAVRAAPPAAVRALDGAGPFVRDAVHVLAGGGRVTDGSAVVFSDRLERGVTILVPPDDPTMIGTLNRELQARNVGWRFGQLVEGEWLGAHELVPNGVSVRRRYRMSGEHGVIATMGGEPWIVRDGNVIIVASRLDEAWTSAPVTAAFVPLVDFLTNHVAARQASIVRGYPGSRVTVPTTAAMLDVGGVRRPIPSDGQLRAPSDLGAHLLVSADGDTIGVLELNHDPRESLPQQATLEDVRSTLGPRARLVAAGALPTELFREARRAELAGALLIAALITAIGELTVATLGSRRSA